MTIVFDHLPALWHGLVKTLGLTLCGFVIGCIVVLMYFPIFELAGNIK